MPKKLNLSDEERVLRKREYQRRYRQKLEAEKERKRQEQAKAKAALMDRLHDPTAPDALKAAIQNEVHGFSVILGDMHFRDRVVIMEQFNCKLRIKDTRYIEFDNRADAEKWCIQNGAKRMKYY